MHWIVCHQRSSQSLSRTCGVVSKDCAAGFLLVMTVVLVRVCLWSSFSGQLVTTSTHTVTQCTDSDHQYCGHFFLLCLTLFPWTFIHIAHLYHGCIFLWTFLPWTYLPWLLFLWTFLSWTFLSCTLFPKNRVTTTNRKNCYQMPIMCTVNKSCLGNNANYITHRDLAS